MSPEFFRMLFGKARNVIKVQVSGFSFATCVDVNRRRPHFVPANQNLNVFYQYFPQLREIQLSDASNRDGTTTSDTVIDLTLKCPDLQVLRLHSSGGLGVAAVDAICSNCEKFNLESCKSVVVEDLIPELTRLTYLSLAQTSVTAETVCRLLQSCDNLEVLDVSGMSFGTKTVSRSSYGGESKTYTPLDISTIPDSLKAANPRSRVHSLIAQGGAGDSYYKPEGETQITDDILLVLIGITPNLQRINLNGCTVLTAISVDEICSRNNWVEVIVSNVCALNADHIETLLQCNKKLRSLDIECSSVKKTDAVRLLKKYNMCCGLVGPTSTVPASQKKHLVKDAFVTLN
eukprot:gene34734-42842_t